MKIYIFISAFLMLSFSKENNKYNDFDSQLTQIVNEFKSNIMDKDKCKNLYRKADYLVDEIENSIEDDDNSEYENNKLIELKKEAEAVEEFIGSVGNSSNSMFVKMDLIYLANKRINSTIVTTLRDKFCADIITISINNYVTTMAFNKTSSNYTVAYKWKLSSATKTGSGNMGLPINCVRHIYDNREAPTQKHIIITSINCTPI
jgi:hypothetical protein